MTRGMPSLAALLGLLAVAGYQNRDKLGELLNSVTNIDGPNFSSGNDQQMWQAGPPRWRRGWNRPAPGPGTSRGIPVHQRRVPTRRP